jgi:hypothetical protein
MTAGRRVARTPDLKFRPQGSAHGARSRLGSPVGGERDESADHDDQGSARLDPDIVKIIGLCSPAYCRTLTEEPLRRLRTLLADLEASYGADKD